MMIQLIALLLFLPVAPPVPERKAGDLAFEPYTFEAADGRKVEAELGRLLVPENRQRPTGRLVELAFVRFKSTSPSPGPPIVYLAGGPGGSGISAARGSRFPLFMAMREVADVIALDQRGTGLSSPNLDCPQRLDAPVDRPGDPEDLARRYRQRAGECAEHWRAEGVDLAAYNTNESADDLEALRVALRAPKISLWSISYGTHLALAFARRHEASLDRAIMAGVEGPSHTYKLPSAIDRQLGLVVARAKADPKVSARVPDLARALHDLDRSLAREPLVVEIEAGETKQKVKVAIGSFDMRRMVSALIGGNPEYLPTLVYNAGRRNTSDPSVQLVARYLYGERTGSIGSAMSISMDCASGASPERLARIRREAARTFLGASIDFPFPEICAGWPSVDLGERFRAPVVSRVPVLFISGTLDARTPPSNAEEVARGFPAAVHLVVDGAAHSDPLFLSSPAIKDVMLEFLSGRRPSTTRLVVPLTFLPLDAAPSASPGR
jgi:pimeloyl-ACP methyl ester carboxylesterase